MINRTENFWLVGFFLSKYGSTNERDTLPPIELGTSRWNEAYYMFYDSLSAGRTVQTFEHSLKNARDAFDSHLQNSSRIGWLDENRRPRKLEKTAELVFSRYSKYAREEIWKIIQDFVSNNIENSVVNDIITDQESTNDAPVITKIEGGRKAITIYKYERNLTLRSLAFRIHGYSCAVCGFNFERFYGIWGKEFAEVHHL